MTPLSLELRAIPPAFDQRGLAGVDQRLADIVGQHRVAIGLAVESGSRAWGFPSPDSDFDCRFIFIRHPDDYLSPWPKRDVIETALTADLDVNGWELGKALKLLLKGNAVAVEWLMSPIVYAGDRVFRDGLAAVARHADRDAIARHYRHLGIRQCEAFLSGDEVRLKKLFYALRPAVALRWMRLHPEATIPPMHFPALLRDCDAPPEIVAICEELIDRKARTRELGSGPLPLPIRRFIEAELSQDPAVPAASRLSAEGKAAAERFFRHMVRHFADGASSRHPRSEEA